MLTAWTMEMLISVINTINVSVRAHEPVAEMQLTADSTE